jgi:hypothetical protein
LIDGQALIADLRARGGAAGPVQVWNHAIFHYSAEYQQTSSTGSAAGDRFDMTIKLEISANEDVWPSTGSPVLGSQTAPMRKSMHMLRLVFDENTGEIAMTDPKNQWQHCGAQPNFGFTGATTELYAPDYLRKLLPVGPSPERKTAQNEEILLQTLAVGNVYVEREPVFGPNPALKLRRRYK